MCVDGGRQTRNVLHQQDPHFFYFTQEKRRNCNFFGTILRMEDVLLIFFEQIASLCQINPSYFVITYNNSGLIPTNYTDRVIFCVTSCTFYPSPKQFYASGASGKFHVWRQIYHNQHSNPQVFSARVRDSILLLFGNNQLKLY